MLCILNCAMCMYANYKYKLYPTSYNSLKNVCSIL